MASIVSYLTDPFGSTFPGGCNLVSARDVAVGHLLIARMALWANAICSVRKI